MVWKDEPPLPPLFVPAVNPDPNLSSRTSEPNPNLSETVPPFTNPFMVTGAKVYLT